MADRPDTASLPRSFGAVSVDFSHPQPDRAVLLLAGRLDLNSATQLWSALPAYLIPTGFKQLVVDVSALTACDGAGMALLHHLHSAELTPGVHVFLEGLRPEFETIYKSYQAHPEEHVAPSTSSRTYPALPVEVGKAAVSTYDDIREQITFLGHIASAVVSTLFDRRLMRWKEVLRIFEIAGVNALPIVSLISLLVGLIIAFESAQPLAQFGAQIFIANMIGLIMIRELGPMMTAIILAGRSGSAFAAEIGTMKVNEELNALQTMGLDPVRFLVVQRVVAGILLTPVLTLYSMVTGVLGGVIVMRGLGFPFVAIFNQIVDSVVIGDVLVGTAKGCVFGLIVSCVGCLRGLQTKKGPSAVGESTTRAVVSSILLIILADALFSLLLFVLEK